MASPLAGSLAATVGTALAFVMLDATLTRYVQAAGSNPADPPLPTTVVYTCKAMEESFSTGLLREGLVEASDVNVLVLAKSFKNSSGAAVDVTPQPLDRITIRSRILTVVPSSAGGLDAVRTDPARATWSLRCSA